MTFEQQKKQAYQLASTGDLKNAKHLLEQLSVTGRVDADIWFMLGAVCGSMGILNESIGYLEKAIDLKPDHIDALYNLGIASSKSERHDRSIQYFQRVLESRQNHHEARLNLAIAYCHIQDFDKAQEHLKPLKRVQPENETIRFYSAQALLGNSDHHSAITELSKVVTLNPSNELAYKLMGDAFKEIGKFQNAAEAYHRAIKLNPEDSEIYRDIGVAFKSMEMFTEAAECFKATLRISPDMTNIKFQLATLGEAEDPGKAPADYVAKLFDYFSDTFEDKLLNDLEYKTPYVLGELIRKYLTTDTDGLDVLDLGCGTGLCGPVLKSLSHRLVGVDLSPKMLELAKSKKVYDELIEGDITENLFPDRTSFDLIVAADVFVYVGDLAPIFNVSHSLLTDRGLFAFSTEVSEENEKFTLQHSGRYKHATDYLIGLAKQFGFRVEEVVSTEIRKNKNVPVMGNLVLLAK